MRIAFNFCVHAMARHFAELSEDESCLAQLKKRTRKTENEALKVNDNTIIELSSRKISSQIWQRQIIDLLAPDIFAQPRPTIDNYKHVQV